MKKDTNVSNLNKIVLYSLIKQAYIDIVGKDYNYQEGYNLGRDMAHAIIDLMDLSILEGYVPKDTAKSIIKGFVANMESNVSNLIR